MQWFSELPGLGCGLFVAGRWGCSVWRRRATQAGSAAAARRPLQEPRGRRQARFERLETRRCLVAEGAAFELAQAIDASDLLEQVTAVVEWGDGSSSPAAVEGGAAGPLKARLDYRYDTLNFFDTSQKRELMQRAADAVLARFDDSLAAIRPGGSNSWQMSFFSPLTGLLTTAAGDAIAANELLIFVGGRTGMSNAAVGGPGGFHATGAADFLAAVQTRGQSGAGASPPTDVAPWGGSISFSSTRHWHFGLTTEGLDSGETDFLSTAVHELAHVMGFGTSASWDRLVDASQRVFRGARASAEYDAGGPVPLDADLDHWASHVTEDGRQPSLSARLTLGTRKLLSDLDYAALQDLGWQFQDNVVTVRASHIYGDNGAYPVVVRLASSTGTLERTLPTTVTNVAPTLAVPASATVAATQVLSLVNLGIVEDAGFARPQAVPPTVETFIYEIDWGDGTALDRGAASIDRVGSPGQTTRASFDGQHVYSRPGSYTVRVQVQDDDGGTVSRTFPVTVTVLPMLQLQLAPSSVPENAGNAAVTATLTRIAPDYVEPLTVTLASSDASELRVPATITLAAGQRTVTLPLEVLDDRRLDGTQTVTVTATSAGFRAATAEIEILDHEFLTLAMPRPVLSRAGPTDQGRVTVRRSNTDVERALAVTLTADAGGPLKELPQVVISAGEVEVSFVILADEDFPAPGPQRVRLEVSAVGYVAAALQVDVVEQAFDWTNPVNALDVNLDGFVSPLDALLVINDLNAFGSRALAPRLTESEILPPFVDVFPDRFISPLDVLLIFNWLNGE